VKFNIKSSATRSIVQSPRSTPGLPRSLTTLVTAIYDSPGGDKVINARGDATSRSGITEAR